MRAKLEFKILAIVVVLLLIGVAGAGILVLTIEKAGLYSMTSSSLELTTSIIAQDVERAMVEGRTDLAKSMVDELKGKEGVKEAELLNHEGRRALDKTAASPAEAVVMKRIAATKAPELVKSEKRLTFYRPLINADRCRTCHAADPPVLGALKVSFSIEKEYRKAFGYIGIVLLVTVLASLCFSVVLWASIRRLVLSPIKTLEGAAIRLADGDMAFDAGLKSNDEIGRFSRAIRDSLHSIGGILHRIRDVSLRVSHVTEDVERESRKVGEGTVLEAEAINNISASLEEMNAVITEIAEGTEGLAASAEETAASMEEMVSSITQITSSTTDLSMAVESTSASIEQLSATIREVANNTNELAVAAEDTQSAITEIAASIKEVEQRAKESALLSEKVKKDAISFGMTSIEKTIKGMQDIQASVEKTADCIGKLGGRSEEIGNILNVIDDITDQTTLLALNAAILAAQAGEHGKGFSVVADEIKSLAERTSLSTQEIAELIQAVRHEVADAVDAMGEGLKSVESGFAVTQEAADALRKIIETTKRSSDMATAIEYSTTEQSQSARLVSEAMEKVLAMVGSISKATTEQDRGIQLIMKATEKINEVTAHVKIATGEQSLNSKQISQAIELVSDKSQQISRAINEQKIGSNQILTAIEKIRELPKENRDRAFNLNQMVQELMKDAELTVMEMEKFKFAADAGQGVLRLGIIPLESPAVMFRRFTPLAEYLGRRLGRKIDLKVAVDFQGAVADIGQGMTQVCYMTPSTYVEAHEKYGVRVLVKAMREGRPFQHSVIVVRNDSTIQSVEDIKGRSFAFGDPHSTSSHIVPRGMLLAAGVDLKDLQYYNYLGHHDDVARAVVGGDFDAGGIMESTAYRFRDEGLRFVKFSEDIPEFNICASPQLDEEFSAALKDALCAITAETPEGAAILKSMNPGYTGFVEAADEDYAGVRLMMTKLGMI
jgi:phosphate/phosphite/phosphonate ABC transporter binding protein